MNLSSGYFDEPENFRNVQEVLPIFTIGSFNFTTSKPDVTECECIEGENDIRWDSELQIFAKRTSAYHRLPQLPQLPQLTSATKLHMQMIGIDLQRLKF